MASAFTRSTPANLVVAEAKVLGGITATARAPAQLRMSPGQALEVKFVFRLQEGHKEEESYRFELSSRLGPQHHPPARVTFSDKIGWPEDEGGFLLNRYTPPPGEHVLHWRAETDYGIRPWGGGEETRHHKVLEGTVNVTVA